jgi:hypothetical protein
MSVRGGSYIAALRGLALALAQFIYEDIFGNRHTSRFALNYDGVRMTSDLAGGEEWNRSD